MYIQRISNNLNMTKLTWRTLHGTNRYDRLWKLSISDMSKNILLQIDKKSHSGGMCFILDVDGLLGL